jgi:hypothetical protein
MTCPFEAHIGDYIDGTLAPDAARAFDSHLAGCLLCAVLIDDFRALRATGRVLERHAPPAALWPRVAAGIRAESGRAGGRWGLGAPTRMLAAAVLVLVVGGAAWLAVHRRAPAQVAVPQAAETTVKQPPIDEVPAVGPAPAGPQVEQAVNDINDTIAGLDAMRKAGTTELDPETAAVVQANLTVIDKAIGESRAALQAEPANSLAQDSLFGALQSKVSLLQDTVALINEMRKGNPEGTARIVSGMNP